MMSISTFQQKFEKIKNLQVKILVGKLKGLIGRVERIRYKDLMPYQVAVNGKIIGYYEGYEIKFLPEKQSNQVFKEKIIHTVDILQNCLLPPLGYRTICKNGIPFHGKRYHHPNLAKHVGEEAMLFAGENQGEINVCIGSELICIANIVHLQISSSFVQGGDL